MIEVILLKMYSRKRKRHLRPYVVILLLAAVVITGAVLIFCKNGNRPAVNTAGITSSAGAGKSVKHVSSSSSSSSSKSSSVIQTIQVSLSDAEKPYWIHVSTAKQTVTVYDADNRVVESWLCSTGSPGHDTPEGTFHIYNRGKSFFSKKYQEGAYYWVAFYEDYYFHSVPYDKNKQIIQSVANDLGRKDSHGCVHLSIKNSKWIYDNIPNGTKVTIE